MIIFPAIDLQNGKAVRLKQGQRHEATIFGDDPLSVAVNWRDQGAGWLHIVDLDAAFDGDSANMEIIKKIAALPGLKTQLGGGVRSLEKARLYLDAGVTRLITGTLVMEDENLFRVLCAEFPGKIGVSLDAANGRLKSRGWLKDCDLAVGDVLPRLSDMGASFIIYTDIERDGMQSGPNLRAMGEVLAQSSLPVIAAGGVSSLEDIKKLAVLPGNLEGVISGRALYEKTLDLKEALAWLSQS